MHQPSLPVQIIDAIDAEDVETLRALFAANPDQLTAHTFFAAQTWLGYAAMKGRLAAARFLIAAGANVNAGDSREGIKPICGAAHNGHDEMIAYLLDSGAVLDVDASVRNPLFAAIVGRSPSIVRLLLERGIDALARYTSPTMRDMDAVAFALMRGETECARVIALWNAKGDEDLARDALSKADLVATRNARHRS